MISLTTDRVWEILQDVKDPEIPAVSVVELGLIRSVAVRDSTVTVVMTPTFIGCPAIQVMQTLIEAELRKAGAAEVEVKVTLSPPWTTNQITPEGRDKLKQFGLAPPPRHAGSLEQALSTPVPCPYCDSTDTELKSSFGSTLCRAIYTCNHCLQPFEGFKPI